MRSEEKEGGGGRGGGQAVSSNRAAGEAERARPSQSSPRRCGRAADGRAAPCKEIPKNAKNFQKYIESPPDLWYNKKDGAARAADFRGAATAAHRGPRRKFVRGGAPHFSAAFYR